MTSEVDIDTTPLTAHPVADLFPMMSAEEYTALVADIREHGQREPIWLIGEQILDGRNRYRACLELERTPLWRHYAGPVDTATLIKFVLSLNLQRRHLSSSQKATLALDVEALLAEEAKERQRAAGVARAETPRNDDGTFSQVVQIFAQPGLSDDTPDTDDDLPFDPQPDHEASKARTQAAAIVGTNRQYVSDAKAIKAAAPDLFDAVRAGDLTIPKAKQEVKKRQAQERARAVEDANTVLPIEQRTYRVIYADPPWKYGNTMPDYFDEQAHHYPLMTVAEIAAMPVRSLAMDDAVLFLWVTSPILFEAAEVIRAWGFTYKASFVWDKIKHNMGHYNSVRHELLLICTRGSCQPDKQQLFDSVQAIERTRHSEKPEQFRTIIDTLYPVGARLELFARRTADGWDSYGNEVSRQPEPALD